MWKLWGPPKITGQAINWELSPISVAECEIHFWRKDLSGGEMMGCMDYMGVRDVASAHYWFTNVGNSVPRVSVAILLIRTFWQEVAGGGFCALSRSLLHWWRNLCWSIRNIVIWCWRRFLRRFWKRKHTYCWTSKEHAWIARRTLIARKCTWKGF